MSDRALPDLVSRVRVDSTGVDAAMLDLVAGFSRAQLAVAGLGAGLGLLILGGKSMLDIAEKEDAAHRGLAQAVDYYNANLGKNIKAHREWIETSKKAAATSKELAAAQRAVSDANYAANLAQAAYTHALYTHGANSEQAMKAEGALLAAKQRLNAAQERENKLLAGAGGAAGYWANVPGQHKRAAISLEDYEKQVASFIHTNAAFISDQAEAKNGFAELIRAGLSQTETMKDMNRAVDLSAIKHISLTDAVDLVNQAEHGRYRGLIDLGIAQKDYVDKNGKVLTGSKLLAAVMADLDKKTKGGRDTLSELTQDQNKLANDWQELATNAGPGLEKVLDTILTKTNDAYTALENFGKDNTAWAGINNHLVDIAQAIHDNLLEPLQAVWDAYTGQKLPASPISRKAPQSVGGGKGKYNVDPNSTGENASLYRDKDGHLISVPYGQKPPPGATLVASGPAQSGSSVPGNNAGRASGGPVLPFHRYTVGEHGTEELVMGARGGYVIPHGGSSEPSSKSITVVVNVAGHVQTERSLNLAIREGLRRLDREHR